MSSELCPFFCPASQQGLQRTVGPIAIPYRKTFVQPLRMSVRGSTFDFSIAGDALEQHRILLEKNLQHTADISLHLSSTQDDSEIEQL